MRTLLPPCVLRRVRPDAGQEDGFTLVEMMVAVVLVTGSVLALLGMLTTALTTHRGQRDEAGAERAASAQIETARNAHFSDLMTLAKTVPVTTSTQPGAGGKAYTTTTTLQPCAASDLGTRCTIPVNGAPAKVQLREHVTWQEGGTTKSLDVTSGVADTGNSTLAGAGSSTIGSLVGGAGSTVAGLVVSVSAMSVAPTTASVTAAGHPLAGVTVSADVIGLPTTTTFPMTWTDDTGSHQVTMSWSSGTTWTAVLKTTDLTRVTAAGQTSSIAFAAAIPGATAIPSTTLTLTPVIPPTLSCSAPLVIPLALIGGKTSGPSTLTCTSTNLAATDSVSVGYLLATGATSQAMTTTTGTTWTVTLPAGTALPVNPLTKFTFTATRALDSATVSTSATAAVA